MQTVFGISIKLRSLYFSISRDKFIDTQQRDCKVIPFSKISPICKLSSAGSGFGLRLRENRDTVFGSGSLSFRARIWIQTLQEKRPNPTSNRPKKNICFEMVKDRWGPVIPGVNAIWREASAVSWEGQTNLNEKKNVFLGVKPPL